MRVIKFRGKSAITNEWLYSETLASGIIKRKKDNKYLEINGKWESIIPETLGQFIGNQDKNGIDAYEGDKCDVIYDEDTNTVYEEIIKDIRWIPDLKGSSKDFEIVGNIHD